MNINEKTIGTVKPSNIYIYMYHIVRGYPSSEYTSYVILDSYHRKMYLPKVI